MKTITFQITIKEESEKYRVTASLENEANVHFIGFPHPDDLRLISDLVTIVANYQRFTKRKEELNDPRRTA